MVSEGWNGSEISDIYLKHPANESSEDDEGEEEVNPHDSGKIVIYKSCQRLGLLKWDNKIVDSYGKLEGIDTSGRDTFPQLLITGAEIRRNRRNS